jgi:hypothetical protein
MPTFEHCQSPRLPEINAMPPVTRKFATEPSHSLLSKIEEFLGDIWIVWRAKQSSHIEAPTTASNSKLPVRALKR